MGKPIEGSAVLGQLGNRILEERYRLVRAVKSGAGVQTFLGEDLHDGRRTIVKTALATGLSSATQMRLEHEAHVLRAIGRAGELPRFGRDGDLVYLIQPFVPGTSLAERLEGGALDVSDALRVAADVLRTVDDVPAQGVLHRDITPANVIVHPHTPLRWAVLIDFGLARSTRLDESVREEAVGTARYISPEQAGLLDVPVDERSDLYSVGVLLFESLAGRPPFEGRGVGEVLRQHLTVDAPELRGLGVEVPRAVDDVVQRLLRKDPSDRYQSAAAALADVEDIVAALERGVAEPGIVIGLRDRRHTLTEPAFVGRQTELTLLCAELEQASRGRGGLSLVEADSGGGKTRLLDELAQQAGQRGAWVVRGQGVDQAARRPFDVLEGVAAGLIAEAEADASHEVGLGVRSRVGEHAAAIAATLPELAELLGQHGPGADDGPEAYAEARSLQALPSLLQALGTPARPALVLLDDCQWADELTVSLLARWQRTAAEEGSAVVVIAAFRSEEVGPEHPLRALTPDLNLVLGPFDENEVRSIAHSMAGPLPSEVTDSVIRLCEGSPFMASAVLRGLMECGALVDTPTGWRTDVAAMAGVHTSRRAAAFLIRRLELLPPDALYLLSVGAVLGKEFDLPLAVALADQGAGQAVPALDGARRRHILWVDDDGERCHFVHDKLREALLERLTDDERRNLHLAAAERIEALDDSRVFELAYHFDAAGQADRALPHALRAAEQARAQHALEVAEAEYRLADRAAAAADADTRRRAAEGLGDVLSLRGAYEEAASHLRRARSLAADDVSRAQLDWRLGEVAFRCGDVIEARAELEQGLRRLGRRVPRRGPALVLAALREVLVQVLHTLLPTFFVARRAVEGNEAEFVAIRIYSRLAYVYWFHSGKVACAWAHLREMNLAERYPPTLELAQAYSEHAPVMTMVPWYKRGIAYARESLAIRTSLGSVWGQGQSLAFYGTVLYASSRYREAIDKLEHAVRLLERTGDRWEVNTARWHIAFCLYRLGELEEAVAMTRRVYRDAVEIGDRAATGISLSAWARASGGRVPAELVAEQLRGVSDDAHTATEVHVAEAVRLLGDGEAEAAVAALDVARGIVRRAGLRQEYVAPVLPWLATALRTQLEGLLTYTPRQRAKLLRRATRVSRQASRISRRYRNNLPHALRERGLVAAMRGRERRARRFLDRSLAVAETQRAQFEVALTLRARGRVGLGLGWLGADAEVTAGESAADRLLSSTATTSASAATSTARPAADPTAGEATLSLADRFATLLEVGHKLAAAPSREAVFGAVEEAALTLLRGERCRVIELPEGSLDELESDAGTSLDDVSRTLIRRAVTTGIPLVSDDRMAADASESLVLSGARSVLCAPVHVEGRPIACFYVIHGRIGGLFGREEEQLAAFVATLAGAALENVAAREAERRILEEELRWRASHDSLTALANRALFVERLAAAVARCEDRGSTLAVLFLDLDDFKSVNDTLGHSTGDLVLVAVAERLAQCVRPEDTVARFGGDEFAVLLDEADQAEAERVARRITERMREPVVVMGSELRVHASLGIATGSRDPEELIADADTVMYSVKSAGKGAYAVFQPEMRHAVVERSTLKHQLQSALERDELRLHYQPIVDLATGRILGVEALVRWQHPERGLLYPLQFIGLAEESGLILGIGRWVLRQACLQVQAWEATLGVTALEVCCNVSPRQLLHPALVDEVAEALELSGLDARCLSLEITESAMVHDTEAAITKLHGLKDLGVQLAIDDFGMGYSSLSYLRRMPVDRIKLDKSFVDTVMPGHDQPVLAEAILQLARTLQLRTVAEGIEHALQRDRLLDMGCERGQGYYFARPAPAEEIAGLFSL